MSRSTSLMRGMLEMVTFSGVSSTAQSTCSASFLAPCGVMLPFSFLPPVIILIIKEIRSLKLQVDGLKVQHREKRQEQGWPGDVCPKGDSMHESHLGTGSTKNGHDPRPIYG